MNENVLRYYKAKSVLDQVVSSKKDLLVETNASKRASSELLMKRMSEQGITSVPVGDKFATIVPGGNLYNPIRTIEDVENIAAGTQNAIEDIHNAEVVQTVVRLVISRITKKEKRPDRLKFVSTNKKEVKIPYEVQRLGSELHAVTQDHMECRKSITTLRKEKNEAEKNASLSVKDPLTYQIQRNGQTKILHVEKRMQQKKPNIGVRLLTNMVKDAATIALQDRQNFDTLFVNRLKELANREFAKQSASCKEYIKMRESKIRV